MSSHPPYKLHLRFRHRNFRALASLEDPKIRAIVFSPILRSEGLECCHKWSSLISWHEAVRNSRPSHKNFGFGRIHDRIIYKLSHHAIHKRVISHTFATSWHCHFMLICYHLLAPHVAFRTSLHNRGLYFVSAHVEPVSCLLAFFNRCCWFSTLVYSNCYQHEVYCSQHLLCLQLL